MQLQNPNQAHQLLPLPQHQGPLRLSLANCLIVYVQ